MLTNCKNCGAVLSNGKCEYCKADYTLFNTDASSCNSGRPKLTQEEYDTMKRDAIDVLIGRGGLYGSVVRSALLGKLLKYDLSDVYDAQLFVKFMSQSDIVICQDPITTVHVTTDGTAYYETLKPKQSWWHRLWWGD